MTLKATKAVVALLICMASIEASAQKTITFGSSERSERSEHSRSHSETESAKNSLTLGIASWLNGFVPVYYERAVLPFMSVQVGAGITMRSFSNDFAQVLLNDGEKSDVFDDSYSSDMTDVDDSYENYKYRKQRVGFYASVAPKIYFRDNCMDGFYLAPTFELKHYKYQAQLANVNKTTAYSNSGDYSDDRSVPHVKETMEESMKCYDFSLMIGGHYQTNHHLAVGWSIALGMRSLKAERLDIGTEHLTDGDYYRNALKEYTATRPFFAFNFILGGCF
jgi:hypothetical protein